MKSRWSFLLVILLVSGCRWGEHEIAPSDFQSGAPVRSDKDVLAPIEYIEILNQEINAKQQSVGADVAPEAEAGPDFEAHLPRQFLGLQVELIPKTNGVLRAPVRIEMQKGGGVIDLAEWLSDSFSGSFYLRVGVRRSEAENHDLTPLRVHYLSNTRKVNAGREELGPGCHQLMEITGYFHSEISHSGVKLNTTQFRHLAAIGGTFYFSLFDGSTIHLASLTFEDSRRPDLSCR